MGEDVGRATTDNQHKYPTTGSEGNVAAALDCQPRV